MTLIILFAVVLLQIAIWVDLRLLRDAVDALTRQREPNPASISSVPQWEASVKVRGKTTKVRVQASSESAAVMELMRLGYREAIERLERV